MSVKNGKVLVLRTFQGCFLYKGAGVLTYFSSNAKWKPCHDVAFQHKVAVTSNGLVVDGCQFTNENGDGAVTKLKLWVNAEEVICETE